MNVSFANMMTNKLCKCFFYRHAKETPCIQVGKLSEDLIFWLRYNDEGVAKCASILLREYGGELGISDLQGAKDLLLSFCSEAFNCIDADFFSLSPIQSSVDDIIKKEHRRNISGMFKEYIYSRMNSYPYIYNLEHIHLTGRLKLQDNLYLYGAGEGVNFLSDIKAKTGIEVARGFFDEKGMQDKPIGRYFNQSNSVVIITYASSEEEAVEVLNRLFGALCVTVKNPFSINSCNVNNKIEYFTESQYHLVSFRVNVPSLMKLDIDEFVSENLVRVFSKTDNRILSALSFIAHGWSHDNRERFLNHFIALDAMYGSNTGNKSAIVGGVCRDAKSVRDVSSKIEIIYELRCKFVHGEISTLSGHIKYLTFIDRHGADPIDSLFEILKACVLNYQGMYEARKDFCDDVRTLNVPVELVSDVRKMIESFKNN